MTVEDALSDDVRRLLARARGLRVSYGVRVLASPGSNPRIVVVLGEGHLKLARAARLGKQLVDAFELRGVEGFPARSVFSGRVAILLIDAVRGILRGVSLGLLKGSTITYARSRSTGHTERLEIAERIPLGLHVGAFYATVFLLAGLGTLVGPLVCAVLPAATLPAAAASSRALLAVVTALDVHLLALLPAWALRRHEWSWMIHPMLALVTVRDTLMARRTVHMLAEHPEARAALIILGRGHLAGYERELIEKHGFTRAKD